jgi:hypothetical protein
MKKVLVAGLGTITECYTDQIIIKNIKMKLKMTTIEKMKQFFRNFISWVREKSYFEFEVEIKKWLRYIFVLM